MISTAYRTSKHRVQMEQRIQRVLIFILRIVAFVFDLLTLPVYFVLQKPWWIRHRSKQPKGKIVAQENTYITYRATSIPQKMHVELLREKIYTMAEMMVFYSNKYADKRCLGYRDLLEESSEVQGTGKVFIKNKFGEYIWKTYAQVNVLATSFGLGLRELGNKAGQNVAIFSETRPEWMIAAQGLFKQSMPIVTIYANLGEEGIIHALNETKVTIVITSHELLPKLKNMFKKLPLLDTIIYIEHKLLGNEPQNNLGCGKLRVLKFRDVLKLGSISNATNQFPTASSTAIIMYTSGSTGIPKGVILKHSNLLATLRGFTDSAHSFELNQSDVLIGFLPLAHVFELIVECVCLCSGIAIGYSSPFTLIDSSTKIKEGSRGDAPVLHPTIMTAVPLILDRISKGIVDKVSKTNILGRILFIFAYEYKKFWWYKGYDTPIINRVVFRRITNILGGKVRLILSGGAPLAPETHERIQLCLCARVVQGYGLTETTSCATVMDGHDRTIGRVGPPTTICDIRLQNCDEEGFSIKDKPFPQGEIIVGGDNVSAGYYALEKQTKEDFFDENGTRWFKTGDVGQAHADGVIMIIDRKKDLVKLQTGEYLSLGKVEMELKLFPLVDNVCVCVQLLGDNCVALIAPNEAELNKFAVKLNFSRRFPDVCDDPEFISAVHKKIIEHAKTRKLEKFEIPVNIQVCRESWTPDNGLVTAAYKIRRKEILKYYKTDIEKLFAVNKAEQ